MSAKKVLSSLVKQLSDQFNGRHTDLYQIVHAALGTISPEIASHQKIPLMLRHSSVNKPQFNLWEATLRAKKCLHLSDFDAIGVSEEVVRSLRLAGIRVNQTRLLLDSSIGRKEKRKGFKALCKNLELNDDGAELKPTTATLAIAKKLISKPDITWEGRLALAASFPLSSEFGSLIDQITENECYLWVFPPTDHEVTQAAYIDDYFGEQRTPSAQMGMGFSIIQAGWEFPQRHWRGKVVQYATFTPMWSWRASEEAWRLGNIIESIIYDSYWREERLSDLLPKGLSSLPRIYGCHTCQTLFIDKKTEHLDIPTHCRCKVH